jgi:hypothetical protein
MTCLLRNMKRFRGRLIFKAHTLVYHSTPGLRAIKKEEMSQQPANTSRFGVRKRLETPVVCRTHIAHVHTRRVSDTHGFG